MKWLRILFLLPALAQAQTWYNQTDVISNNVVTLTNKIIDCNSNTCSNFPGGNLGSPGPIGNVTASSGAFTTLSSTGLYTATGGFKLIGANTVSPSGNYNVGSSTTSYIGQNGSVTGSVANGVSYAPVFFNTTFTNFVKSAAPYFVPVAQFDARFGGSGDTGLFGGIEGGAIQTALTGNQGAGLNSYFVGGTFKGTGNANEGGTSGAGNGNGTVFGFNPICTLQASATYWRGCVGGEINTNVLSGTSVEDKVGLQIIQTSVDAVAGTLENSAIVVSNQAGAVGWDIAYAIGQYFNVWPMRSGGSLMACSATNHTGSCGTTTNGIHLTNITFTGNAFDSTGFAVDGSGDIVSNSVLLISTTTPTVSSGFNTSGNSVTGVNTSAFQITVGTGTGTSTGVLTMPTATTGWACSAADVTTPATHTIQQTGSTTTSVTVTDYSRTAGTAQNMANSDKIVFHCGAF